MRIFLFVSIAVFSLTSCSSSPSSKGSGSTRQHATNSADDLILVATSDFHSALHRSEGLASVIRELRAQHGDHMLYLDAGDLFQGSLEGNMSKGKSIVDFFNLIGLDAAALGNHELDFGPDVVGRISVKGNEDGLGNLKARVRQARFKWLSANFLRGARGRKQRKCHPTPNAEITHCNALGQRTVFQPHAIFRRAGKKVCVIGGTTPTTPAITRPEYVKNSRFEELKPVIAAEAAFLRNEEHCDLLLLTVHAGLLCKPEHGVSERFNEGLCKESGDRAEMLRVLGELPPGTVDAVIAGHTHLLAQETINGTPILESGTGAKSVGVMRISGSHGIPARVRFEPFIPVPDAAAQADITALLKPHRDAAAELKARPAGSTAAPFPRDYNVENALVNMIADAVRAAGNAVEHAEIGIINAGGVRTGLPMGTLTYGDIFKVLPFDNSLTIVTLRGAELRRVLEIALSGGHGTGGISGIRVKRAALAPGVRSRFDRDLDGDGRTEDWERGALLEITDEADKPLDDERFYKVATLDFLVSGGDHAAVIYNTISPRRIRIFNDVWVRDIVSDYLKSHPSINPKVYFQPDKLRVTDVPLVN